MNSARINLLAPYGQAECVSRISAAIATEHWYLCVRRLGTAIRVRFLFISFGSYMLVCGFSLMALGRYLARDETRFLRSLSLELDARERNQTT
jgi:hypothetical protein